MEEDWCIVSDDEEFAFVASRHGEAKDPEPEPEPTRLVVAAAVAPPPSSKSCDADNDDAISLDDIDISTLLQDKLSTFEASDAQIVARRAFSLSLLAPEHRHCRPAQANGRCIEVHHGEAATSRKRSVKLAFCGDAAPRAKSFPARLRAEMPSRLATWETEPPTFTPLTVATQDQGTQANFDDVHEATAVTLSPSTESRSFRLQSALERSMSVTKQLRAKSQDHERASLKLMSAEALLESSDYRHERDLFKLQRLESGLVLAKSREKLNMEVQAQLQAEAAELRKQNAELARTSELLTGRGGAESATFADQSIEDLERLEIAVSKGLDGVRAAIRTKYKEAIARKHEDTLCVACVASPATVVLLPCRHQVLCSSCALRVSTCPIDRKDIHDKVLTFGLNAYMG